MLSAAAHSPAAALIYLHAGWGRAGGDAARLFGPGGCALAPRLSPAVPLASNGGGGLTYSLGARRRRAAATPPSPEAAAAAGEAAPAPEAAAAAGDPYSSAASELATGAALEGKIAQIMGFPREEVVPVETNWCGAGFDSRVEPSWVDVVFPGGGGKEVYHARAVRLTIPGTVA